ncbi:hypothetical protein E4U25_008385 [Claviceps purpurea]|nr:hypothetical protein E4U25_008385 [Claviceps purpurea]
MHKSTEQQQQPVRTPETGRGKQEKEEKEERRGEAGAVAGPSPQNKRTPLHGLLDRLQYLRSCMIGAYPHQPVVSNFANIEDFPESGPVLCYRHPNRISTRARNTKMAYLHRLLVSARLSVSTSTYLTAIEETHLGSQLRMRERWRYSLWAMAETSDHETFVPTNSRFSRPGHLTIPGRLRLCCIAVAVELHGQKQPHGHVDAWISAYNIGITCSLSWFSLIRAE